MNTNQSRPGAVSCAYCPLVYTAGTRPACLFGEYGPEGYSVEMRAFMRCTATGVAKKPKEPKK